MDRVQKARVLDVLLRAEREYVSLLAEYTGSSKDMALKVLAEAKKVLAERQLAEESGGGGELTIYFDGASRGNPGEAGAGAVLYDEAGRCVCEISRPLGRLTNNRAEYLSLILALEEAAARKARRVKVFTDSELVANQMTGVYGVKSPALRPLFREAQELSRRFRGFSINHVPREENKRADELANLAIDEVSKEIR